ncbi:PstS family phosphate ABC transporter substrate-binding protein [Cerasicoccus fimbriatus]|uniref:PstS family phosphate ABC transporter substrate-binding protein n=1 Tax=Cerasicoccus fimbriatus TaxID=3014554 RepID=UPI0022B490EE|nr:substrate-binding domain-containing protein [Cerasicoccus sp. TK19100]
MRNFIPFIALLTPLCSMAEWTVVGSDLLAPAVLPVVEGYAQHNDLSISTEFIGSVPGKENLKSGDADLAVLAAPDETHLPDSTKFKAIPIAYEVAYIVVEKFNPLTEISTSQLAGIYGASQEKFNRWGELNLQGPIAQRSILPLALDNDGTIVLELFKFEVLNSGSLKANVNRVNNNLQLMEMIASDSGSIGISNQVLLGEKVRALSVSGDDEFAFGPTPENVHYGEYPLRLSYYLVFPINKQAELKPLLRSLLGDDLAERLDDEGFVPLPENVRKRMLVELDKGS